MMYFYKDGVSSSEIGDDGKLRDKRVIYLWMGATGINIKRKELTKI